MAANSSPINLGVVGIPRRSYVSTGPFHLDIFKYTTSMNAAYQTVGTLTSLSVVGTGTSSNCPGNRVLRENGRRLVPDATPCTPAITTLLVGVYDAVSGLSGFIDPNSPKFAVYGTDRANWLADATNPVGGAKDALGANALLTGTTPNTGSGYTLAIDCTAAKVFKYTLGTSADSQTTTITATAVPVAGSTVILILTSNGNAGAKTIAFTTNFIDEGNFAIPASSSANYVFTFVSDGTTLYETARNVGLLTSAATTTFAGQS